MRMVAHVDVQVRAVRCLCAVVWRWGPSLIAGARDVCLKVCLCAAPGRPRRAADGSGWRPVRRDEWGDELPDDGW